MKLRADWTLQKAIQKQVELEDLVEWAQEEEEEFEPILPMKDTRKHKPPFKTFISIILP